MARPYRAKRWRLDVPDPAACRLLSRELHLSPVTAQVLYNRGLTTVEAARQFLTAGRQDILDPFLLKDMDRAVHLIRDRIAAGGSIMVYGDYDVDGVTGTTILVLALRALGAKVDYYIPDRFAEGYGLNVGALEEIKGRGYDFVLSVDTGTSAVQEADAARKMGITLVVSDHHEPLPVLPDVAALINPKRVDCTYPFKGLSGVGVAFKLALALQAPNAWSLLDIVTLGTIADMVPLVGENRAIVREGLAALGTTQRPGLIALMEVAGVKQPVTATHIGYNLGPRINALGRMGSAMQGVELLITEDQGKARSLAMHLDAENRSRQEVEAAILQEALTQAEQQTAEEKAHVLVLAGDAWHPGVVGICASRVLETYYRPTILLTAEGEAVRGSARSIPAFHMHRALSQVSDLFAKFGGHAAAAGMTLKRREDVAELRRRLNQIGAEWLRPEDLVPELVVDAVLGLEQVNEQLIAELQQLEPHGIGNPTPVFIVENLSVLDSRFIGREAQHLKLLLQGSKGSIDAVGWNLAPIAPRVRDRIRVAFYPEWDTYQGRNRVRLTLKDLRTESGVTRPALPPEAIERWNPLEGLGQRPAVIPGTVIDGREHRLQEASGLLLQETAAALEQPAAAGLEPGGDHAEDTAEMTRLRYIASLSMVAAGSVLVRTNSPWAAVRLYDELQRLLPDLRHEMRLWPADAPEPEDGLLVVAPYGRVADRRYGDVVLYHPPYHEGQLVGQTLHLLWEEADWRLGLETLSWPYPDRDTLVQLFKLLKAGEPTAEALSQALGEVPGPWSEARLQAGLATFAEMGLVDARGRLENVGGARFQLESSSRYRSGEAGRSAMMRLASSGWPSCIEAL